MTLEPKSQDEDSADDLSPLPLIIAEKWDFPLAYAETEYGIVYAVRDWIAGLAGTSNPKQAWDGIRRNDDMSDVLVSIQSLPYQKSNGVTHRAPFVDAKSLYKIAAYLRATKSRPALRAIKDYLAKAGVFTDLARRDPEAAELTLRKRRRGKYLQQGRAPEWIATRELGIVTRKEMMAIVYDLLQSDSEYGIITNDTYRGVFGMTAKELRQHIGIPQSAVVRDHFSTMALVYTQAAEEACRLKLSKYEDGDIVETDDVRSVVITLSRLVGQQAKEMSRMLGTDVVTGEPLLGNGKDE